MVSSVAGEARTAAQRAEARSLLTSSERRTYQSLLARGFSHDDALAAALDGVDVHNVRDSAARGELPKGDPAQPADRPAAGFAARSAESGPTSTTAPAPAPIPAPSRPLAEIKADPLVATLSPWLTGDLAEEWPGDDAALIETVRGLIDAQRGRLRQEVCEGLRDEIHRTTETAINSVYGTDDRHANMGYRVARTVIDKEPLPWRL